MNWFLDDLINSIACWFEGKMGVVFSVGFAIIGVAIYCFFTNYYIRGIIFLILGLGVIAYGKFKKP